MPYIAVTKGAHHIRLTVPNLTETRAFFPGTLGFSRVGEMPDYPAVFLTEDTTVITLWQVNDSAIAVPFNRKNNTGLHHFALKIDGPDIRQKLHGQLSRTDSVRIGFAPEPLGGGPTKYMMCYIPGGIHMEFTAPTN